MATAPSSVYSPVEARSIRLLHLKAGQHDDPLQFSLESVTLDSDPVYEAISYCWGHHNARQDVSCMGVSMSITTSLAGALREFRHNVEDRILWADGVCINQEDENEKTRQVRLMQEIYAKAKIVLVWLVPMDEAGLLSNICKSIKELLEFLPSLDMELPPEAQQNLVSERMNRDRREGRPTIEKHDWKALVELLRRPWFTRKWVVQEVAMAQEVRLHIGGGAQLSWVDLSSLSEKLDSLGVLPLLSEVVGPQDRMALAWGVYNILIMRVMSYYRAAELGTLVDAVIVTSGLSCSDRRDHIYGVLSCASEGPMLDPDYGLSVEDTFKRFANAMLAGGNLKVLSLEPHKGDQLHPGVPRSRTGLPSWVPDLRRQSDLLARPSFQLQLFCAGGSRNPVLSLSDDGLSLRCLGLIVDEIEDFVPSTHEMLINEVPGLVETYSGLSGVVDPNLQRIRQRSYRWMRACYDLGNSQACAFDKPGGKDAFSCALLCDQGSSAGGQASSNMISTTFEYMECVLSQDYSTLPSEQRFDKMSHGSPSLAKLWVAIEREIANQRTMRNFSVTTGGRFGQMPIGTEKGDLVCVLIGGEVPFVLRPTGHGSSSYRLIGECFLNGVMNGEMLVANEYVERQIVLV